MNYYKQPNVVQNARKNETWTKIEAAQITDFDIRFWWFWWHFVDSSHNTIITKILFKRGNCVSHIQMRKKYAYNPIWQVTFFLILVCFKFYAILKPWVLKLIFTISFDLDQELYSFSITTHIVPLVPTCNRSGLLPLFLISSRQLHFLLKSHIAFFYIIPSLLSTPTL